MELVRQVDEAKAQIKDKDGLINQLGKSAGPWGREIFKWITMLQSNARYGLYEVRDEDLSWNFDKEENNVLVEINNLASERQIQ